MLMFLDRTMMENYVLHPHAIAQILHDHDESVGPENITTHLAKVVQPGQESAADAATILAEIFSTFTNNKTEFRKTRDVPALIFWLLEHDPEFLAPLGSFLRQVFKLPSTEPVVSESE